MYPRYNGLSWKNLLISPYKQFRITKDVWWLKWNLAVLNGEVLPCVGFVDYW